MKRKAFLIVMLCFASLVVLGCHSPEGEKDKTRQKDSKAFKPDKGEFHLRKVRWGMNKEEVKRNETAKFILDGEDSLFYIDELRGFKCIITYIFSERQPGLSSAVLQLSPHQQQTKEEYLSKFKEIKDVLSLKYGNPKDEDISMSAYSLWDGSISFSQWKTTDTWVYLNLSAKKRTTDLVITYMSSQEINTTLNEIKQKELEGF